MLARRSSLLAIGRSSALLATTAPGPLPLLPIAPNGEAGDRRGLFSEKPRRANLKFVEEDRRHQALLQTKPGELGRST